MKTLTDHVGHVIESTTVEGVTFPKLNGRFSHLNNIWLTVQYTDPENPKQITRWDKWRSKAPSLALQNLPQHEISLTSVVNISCMCLEKIGKPLNSQLLIQCALLHDYGERKVGDITCGTKKAEQERREYEAFAEAYGRLPKIEWLHHQMCYLIQAAHKECPYLPMDAQEVLSAIKRDFPHETEVFPAFEAIDYLFTAYNGFHRDGVRNILFSVSARHVSTVNHVADVVPGFKEAVWPNETSDYFNRAAQVYNENPDAYREPQMEMFEDY